MPMFNDIFHKLKATPIQSTSVCTIEHFTGIMYLIEQMP
jgi:hypothetical protein